MSSWQAEYLAALEERDKVEKANISIYAAYTRLADKTIRLHDHIGTNDASSGPQLADLSIGQQQKGQAMDDQASNLASLLFSIRQDLSEAQKMRADLQSRLDSISSELERLKQKSTVDVKRNADLTSERGQLLLKLRDRDEELKGKSKLLENVQDELVALNLQVNMSDERNQKLQEENQDLIDRWMARMGQEADAMNNASKFS